MLVPLTELDAGMTTMALCPCFVFALPPGTDEDARTALVERVRGAAQRVVDKWKHLQGTPEWTKDGVWANRIPEDDEQHLKRSTVGFSTATYEQPYHLAAKFPAPLPPLSSSPSGVSPLLNRSFFRPSYVPQQFSAHAKHKHPLVHLHVSLFADALAVGVSVPHALLDGHGIGILLRALTAELHGEEWVVPPLPAEGGAKNPLSAAFDRLKADETIAVEAKETLTPSRDASWTPVSVLALLVFLVSILMEKAWGKDRARRVFIRQDLVDSLVERVKEEVKVETEGREYVSAGDVLTAWLLKTVHAGETSSDSVVASGVFNMRPLLDSHRPSPSTASPTALVPLSLYPFNCALNYQLLTTPLPLSTLASTPLSALSLSFRRNLAQYRSLLALQSFLFDKRPHVPAVVPVRDPPQLPFSLPFSRRSHTHRWVVTNQVSIGIADLSIPDPTSADGKEDLPLLQYCLDADMPILPDHMVSIQRVPGGLTMSATMRMSRWRKLEKAIEGLEREVKAA
ncbi:hypothetical protein JCM8547_005985 [Rhodosporidiobolus lusitaniae]